MKNWEFQEFRITKIEHGDLKGSYRSLISFKKGIRENLTLSLTDKEADQIFNIIKNKVPEALNDIIKRYAKEKKNTKTN